MVMSTCDTVPISAWGIGGRLQQLGQRLCGLKIKVIYSLKMVTAIGSYKRERK